LIARGTATAADQDGVLVPVRWATREGHRRVCLGRRGRPLLTGDGKLKGIDAAGSGAKKEPKYVAMQVVIGKMNDLFGAESFTESQVREFVHGLVQRLLAYPDLVRQTKVNSKKQFLESQD